ncbi:Piwi domain-containing protein [Xylaria intraflava]|nr:Piwi domain-containing protein [Xylaria intraflava]
MSGLRAPNTLVEKIANLDIDSLSAISGSQRGSIAGSHRGSVSGSQVGSQAGSRPGSRGGSVPGSSKADAGHPADPDSDVRPVDIVGRRVDLPAEAYLLEPAKSRFTRRPGFNKTGKAIQVQLNLFPIIEFDNQKTIYQYDVDVSPNPRQSRNLVKKVWDSDVFQTKLSEAGGEWLYDGNKLAWSSKDVPVASFRVTVDIDTDKPSKRNVATTGVYVIKVVQSKKIDLNYLHRYLHGLSGWDNHVLECMNVIDHCMRQTPSETMIQIRRNFYPKDCHAARLSLVTEVHKGYYAAARLSEAKKIMINIDSVNTAFWRPRRLSDIALALYTSHDPDHETHDWISFWHALKPVKGKDKQGREIYLQSDAFALLRRLLKVRFHVRHRGKQNDKKVYTISSFVCGPEYGPDGAHSQNVKFDKKMPDGTIKETTIWQHYYETYELRLEYAKLPIIRTTRGGMYPLELCDIVPDQRYPYKLTPEQTAAMIKFAVTRPPKRKEDILDGAEILNYSGDKYLTEYGFKVSPNMQITNARLLPNPEVTFGGSVKHNPGTTGRWDLRGKRFLELNTKPLKSWGLVVCGTACSRADGEVFGSKFAQAYRNHGGDIQGTLFVTFIPFNFGNYGAITEEGWNRTKKNFKGLEPQMMFFVVQNKNALVYERIKKSMDCRFCCPSQILLGGHVSNPNPQYLSNVAMKVNAKLGGITCKASVPGAGPSTTSPFFKVPTMMIGVDVSHAAPGSGAPSMAALTVSMDKTATRYAAACETNGWRDEVLHADTANSIFPDLLKAWIKIHKMAPAHVYYFRDGIDEGQFYTVISAEVSAFKRIFQQHNVGVPKFTVIIATKRHHIRFFPKPNDRTSGDRNGNPLPGTLVEHDATHPHHFDFYLCSHAAIQGTARPVHYQVIHDEVGVTPDLLQKMIYHQCYQYVRSTTPVSLHPAIYYAHVASNRARSHENIESNKKELKERRGTGMEGHPLARHHSKVYPESEQNKLDRPRPLLPMKNKELPPDHVEFMNNTMWYI